MLAFSAVSGWDSTLAGNGDVAPPAWCDFEALGAEALGS